MAYPVFKPNSSWFTPTLGTTKRNIITTINIVDTYIPSDVVTDSWDASVAQDGSIMCYVEGTILTISGNGSGKIAANEDASWMFSDVNTTDYFSVLTAINGADLLDMSNATTVMRFLNKCVLLESIDVSKFDMSSCTDTSYMFNSCTKLEVIDVANWDVSKVQTMRCMFQTAQKANMGNGAVKVLDVAKWNTSSCTNMSYLFYGCGNLTELPISNWDVSNVTEYNHTFCDCYNLQSLNLTKWNVSKCNTFNAMFNDCNSIITIDLTGWDTSNVISFSQMFESMTSLEYIYGLETWNTSSGKNFGEMFRYCNNLKELDLSSFDTRNATTTYKHPNSEVGLNNMFASEMYRLEKVTLGVNWTFLGDGGCTKGYFPTPSSEYIEGADGNWYTIEGDAYAPANVPNFTYATYYAKSSDAIWDRDSKKYMHLSAMRHYHDLQNAEIDAKYVTILESSKSYSDANLVSAKAYTNSVELITVDEIDAICGGDVRYAEEVSF